MGEPNKPRILIVDDEEAILETMSFTFEREYEVHTSSDARRALDILDQHGPFAAVLTDQRMPNMSGVEFLSEVCHRHPATVRMILTGFADMDAIIEAINDGHVYAYVTKPWEPDQLKQLMRQAVGHHQLSVLNQRLLEDLKHANVFLEAVMDQLDTGALAIDVAGVVQAVNRPVRNYLALGGELRGRPLQQVLEENRLGALSASIQALVEDGTIRSDEIEIAIGDRAYRMRVVVNELCDAKGTLFGRVVLLREISHEPLRRRLEDAVNALMDAQGSLRPALEQLRSELHAVAEEVKNLHIDSPGLGLLGDQISRASTAITNWLDVDDALSQQDYPDVQLLQDRLRVALVRWPHPKKVPERVRQLARRVEEYYESGENPRQPVL